METLIDILIILLSIAVIAKGAIWLVDSAVNIASRLGISELVIGLTVVAFGTSAPEFVVTIMSAFRDIPDVSVGNIVGSNIFNLGFILGGTAIIHSLRTSRTLVQRDGVFLLFGTVLLTVLLWDLTLNHVEGAILFTLLISYIGFLYWKKETIDSDESEKTIGKFRRRDILTLLLGMGMVVGGSHFLVESAVDVARTIGLSEWVIGVTIVAAGTSAPEFATSITAALRGRHGMSVGNLIGSDLFNIIGVLGLTAILRDLSVDTAARQNLIFLSVMVIIVLIFMRTGWQISRREGIALFIVALARWVYSFI
ncbi:MAG: calcium/sodium antiporter [Chloroflexi bacterium]|nr:calcium/sodium antiporter [Chloroflexota bacterium]